MRGHPEFIAERAEGEAAGEARRRAEGRAEGRAESLFIVLTGRGLESTEDERRRIRTERVLGRLERWLAAAPTCGTRSRARRSPSLS